MRVKVKLELLVSELMTLRPGHGLPSTRTPSSSAGPSNYHPNPFAVIKSLGSWHNQAVWRLNNKGYPVVWLCGHDKGTHPV